MITMLMKHFSKFNFLKVYIIIIRYNPFKSDVFSLGMTVLRMMGLDKK